MANVWLPKLWASTIPSIWTCGRPNSEKGARRYGPRNPWCAVNLKSEQILFQGQFGDLIFVSKERYEYQSWRWFRGTQIGHRICIISCTDVGDMAPARKGWESGKSGQGWFYGNQVCFSPKEDLVQNKVEHAPRNPKDINTTPRHPKMVTHWHLFIGEPPEITTRWMTPMPCRGAAGVGGRWGLIFIGWFYLVQWYHA
jgi:hypothetical protein